MSLKKVVGLGAAGLLLTPFAVAFPALAVAANDEATKANSNNTCTSGPGPQPVDTAAVAAQVKQILNGLAGPLASVSGLDSPSVQIPNARTIVATGIAMQVPARGQTIALATALQESGLSNLSSGDRDSLGLFQQRPSQGWGTPVQIQDPVYASTSFYKALLGAAGWQQLPLTMAAQAVQKSGYPDAYAKWENLATALQQAISQALPGGSSPGGSPSPTATPAPSPSSGGCGTGTGTGTDWGTIPPGVLPAGYQIPTDAPLAVQNAIKFALGQLGTPYQWGGDCTAPHGPDPMGRCDCSSLMQQSYKTGGVTLTRTTYTQVSEGTAVSVDALRPGDLLFIEPGPQGPEHVGMFIGQGLVVHAPKTGDVVKISTLDSWKAGIVAARRVAT
ncbi:MULTISPECIES: C40 family peptidase [unclassified Kitasatospora]|uniref:C40 family peptidase n=1 Tax=unclassified Kitasatospora TaxID=2633591 RepID=UPI0033EB6734